MGITRPGEAGSAARQRAGGLGDVRPGVAAEVVEAVEDGPQGPAVGPQRVVFELLPAQRRGDGRAGAGARCVGRDDGLGGAVAGDVQVEAVVALVLVELGRQRVRMLGGQLGGEGADPGVDVARRRGCA